MQLSRYAFTQDPEDEAKQEIYRIIEVTQNAKSYSNYQRGLGIYFFDGGIQPSGLRVDDGRHALPAHETSYPADLASTGDPSYRSWHADRIAAIRRLQRCANADVLTTRTLATEQIASGQRVCCYL
jgi:hypothetical protein